MPPRICPPPPDCPLYEQRLNYGSDEPLRRAILLERSVPDLAALIRAEASAVLPSPGASEAMPAAPPTRPALSAPEPVLLSILNQLRKEAS